MENGYINPWLHIWCHPRKTMRYILATNPKRMILWLALVSGMIATLSFFLSIRTQPPPLVRTFSTLSLVGILIAGGLIGLIHLYVGGWLYRLTGSWIGGQGTFIGVKSAVGWSNYPFLIASLLGICGLVILPHLWLQILFGLLNFIVLIWGLVIFVKLLSEAHNFSVWRGILTILLGVAIIFAIAMLLTLLIPLLTPLFQ
jgi:hypothetical protein